MTASKASTPRKRPARGNTQQPPVAPKAGRVTAAHTAAAGAADTEATDTAAQAASGDLSEGEVARLQAASEGARPAQPTVEFKGKKFRVSYGIPRMALMKFAAIADTGAGSESMAGMAAMHALLRFAIYRGEPCTCETPPAIEEGEWHTGECGWTAGDFEAFESWAMETYATGDEFLDLVARIVEAVTARPTVPLSGSSATGGGTSAKSKGRLPSEADGLVPVADLL